MINLNWKVDTSWRKKKILVVISAVLMALFVAGHFLGTAFGAPEDVLNGDGSMDTSLQIGAWTLNNNSGNGTWELDNTVNYMGTGSGKLSSAVGSAVSVDSYVYYRFATTKVPISASLDLAYKKQYINAQPSEGSWNVEAQIWEVGGNSPLESVPLDAGITNIDFTPVTKTLSSITKYNTQYELRLVQKGQTGADPTAQLITWFDEVRVNITYDSTPPQVVSAIAPTDRSVDVIFDEQLEPLSAENTANYLITPVLNITDAVLQADGKTVKLVTDAQVKGTSYTVTVNNIQDVSLNTMTAAGTAAFTGVDTTPPAVASATAMKDNMVSVKFNEQVDTVTAAAYANYTISPSLTVVGATLLADGQTVEVTTSTQTLGTVYTLTASNVKDLSGNIINDGSSAEFTGVDTTPPRVVSAVSVDETTVDLVFNEKVDQASAETFNNYSVSPELSISSAILQADGKTIRLTTTVQTWQTTYTATVNNVKDISGNIISDSNTANFSGSDDTAPKVLSATPVNDSTVDILFSEAVDAVTSQSLTGYNITPGLTVQNAVLQSDGKTVRLTTAVQTHGSIYYLEVTGVKDLAGNTINGNNTVTFEGIDMTAPSVVSAVAINYNTVDLLFNERVDSVSAQTAANYSISPALGIKEVVLQPDAATVRITTDPQTGGTAYTITVTGVKDGAGNLVGVNNTAGFAGVSPPVTSPPEVLSAAPTDNISLNVVFSVTMDPVTAQDPTNYTVSPALPITGATLQKDGVTVKLSTATQTGGEVYIVTVTNVKDQYGNIIGTVNNSASFTGSSVVSVNPHGRYLSDTNKCSQCHATHTAAGERLINQQDQTQMCYLCHDAGGQSQYDIAGQFGLEAPYAVSHHKVPEGTMQCSDCHNPHDGGKDINGNDIHWARLLQSSADRNIHGGNEFCFSCHKDIQGNLKALDPNVYPLNGTGHNDSSYIINGTTPFSPDSGTDISCMGCHQEHGSSQPKLLRDTITGGDTPITGNNETLCLKCHTNASPDNRFPGKTVAESVYNSHALVSSPNTNVTYPGSTGQEGQCANCHDPHGSAYGTSKVSMKTLRGSYNDGKTQYIASDFALCFGCHNNTSANAKYDIQTPYNSSQGGHYIKSSGGNLIPGSKMPCEACHSLHGSANNNKYMLKDSLGSNLGDGRNECLACHQTGKVVEGITMAPPPAVVPEHTGTAACLSCHGSAHAPVK